jgi:hypothetical protein
MNFGKPYLQKGRTFASPFFKGGLRGILFSSRKSLNLFARLQYELYIVPLCLGVFVAVWAGKFNHQTIQGGA